MTASGLEYVSCFLSGQNPCMAQVLSHFLPQTHKFVGSVISPQSGQLKIGTRRDSCEKHQFVSIGKNPGLLLSQPHAQTRKVTLTTESIREKACMLMKSTLYFPQWTLCNQDELCFPGSMLPADHRGSFCSGLW